MATFLCPQGGLYGEVRLYLLLFARSLSTLVLLGYGYLLDMIEKIQKRVLRRLHPDLSYLGVLAVTFFQCLQTRRNDLVSFMNFWPVFLCKSYPAPPTIASHGRDEIRAPLKTPACEATPTRAQLLSHDYLLRILKTITTTFGYKCGTEHFVRRCPLVITM